MMTAVTNHEDPFMHFANTAKVPSELTLLNLGDTTMGDTQVHSTPPSALAEGDSALFQCEGGSYPAAANLCHFEHEESKQNETSQAFDSLDKLLQNDHLDLNDPNVQKVLAFVRKIEDENIKALLDALEHSLEHARKLMEQHKRYIKEVVIPKEESLNKIMQQEKIQALMRQQAQ